MTTSSELPELQPVPPAQDFDVTVMYLDPVVEGTNCRVRRRRVEHVAAEDMFAALRDVATRAEQLGFDVRGLVVERADIPTEPEA
jgi:hypothetical protein